MNKLKQLFIPTESNNYNPGITRSAFIFLFSIIVFFTNYVIGHFDVVKAATQMDQMAIVALHNQKRIANGLSPLSVNTLLNKSAQTKVDAMLESNCWSHYCPEGKSPWDFFDAVGYDYVYAGENLAQGFFDIESLMQAWMNSPTHKENILKPEFDEIGVGIASGNFQGVKDNIIIAVHFGSRYEYHPNSTNTFESTIIPSNGDISKPVVIYPEEGVYINDNLISVTGTVENANYVDVIHNQQRKGLIDVSEGIFIYKPNSPYKDGEQVFEFIAYSRDGLTSLNSDPRTFFIDTEVPNVLDNKVRAKSATVGDVTYITLEFSASEELSYSEINIKDKSIPCTQISNLTWNADIEMQLFDDNSDINLHIVDFARNSNHIKIIPGNILGLYDMMQSSRSINLGSINLNTFFDLFDTVAGNLKIQVNLVFIIFILVILVIDFTALKRTGLTNFTGKVHLHLSNFIILFLVILLGGVGGVLVPGINT